MSGQSGQAWEKGDHPIYRVLVIDTQLAIERDRSTRKLLGDHDLFHEVIRELKDLFDGV